MRIHIPLTISLYFLFGSFLFSQSEYLDRGFGDDGIFHFDIEDENYSIFYILTDSESNLYSELSIGGNNPKARLYKITSEGILDNSFAEEGYLEVDLETEERSQFYVFNDQLIELIPFASTVRVYNLDGLLDSEFSVPEQAQSYSSLIINSSNNLILFNNKSIAEYDLQGNRITSFGENGAVSVHSEDPLDSMNLTSVFQRKDNSYILSSHSNPYNENQNSIVQKLNSNGQVDENFGDNGTFSSNNLYTSYGINEHPNGDLYLNTWSFTQDTSCVWNFNYSLFSLSPQGELREDFGIDGFLNDLAICEELIPIAPSTLLSNNLILDAGWRYVNPDQDTIQLETSIKLYYEDGSPVSSFGENGILVTDFEENTVGWALATDHRDNIYIGYVDDVLSQGSIAKLDSKKFGFTGSSLQDDNFILKNNPSHGDFSLQYTGSRIEDVNIQLFDILGRLINSREVSTLYGGDEVSYSNHNLSPSTYLLAINSTSQGAIIKKLIVVE